MKKHLIIIILLITNLLQLSAQKSKDVLYLKNGSIIYGNLVEIVSDQYKMKTADGSIFIFPSADVEKFTTETKLFEGRKNQGFGFGFEAGLLMGAQESDYDAPFSFNFLGGYTFGTKNILSVGSGVEFIGKPYTPLFIEYRRLIFERKTTPYIFVRGGEMMHLGGADSDEYDIYNQYEPYNYKGGLSYAIGTGISWVKEYGNETYLSFAYRYAYTSYQQKEYPQKIVTYKNILNRLEFKFGFRF